ncbi:Calcium/proton exchanger [Mycena olivaceomarginata]|nr:Calcium/proton exchanger [Mycena olivaceomarginata]
MGSLEGTSSDHPLVEDHSQPTDNYSAPVNGEGSNGEASNGGIPMNHIRTRSSLRTRRASTNPEGGPSGRFHFRRAATSLFTPEKKIGQAPGWAFNFADKDQKTLIFVFSFLAIIPLAKLLAFATDELSMRVGQTLAGLLNATLIIALTKCELQVVQSSLLGSILSNLLLVLGMCFFAGGIKYSEQGFGASVLPKLNSSLLTISVIAVLLPNAFRFSVTSASDPDAGQDILKVSHGVWGLPGNELTSPVDTETAATHEEEEDAEEPQLSLYMTLGLLAVVTVIVAVTAEWLVDSIDGLTQGGGITKEFVGVILLPIVGNAAEHVTAVSVSVKDKLTLSLGVAVGSSIQIALFVIPFIMVLAWILGKPLTMLFDPFESIALFLAVITVNYVVQDGKSNWLEGIILMALYVILGTTFFFYPGTSDEFSSILPQCH